VQVCVQLCVHVTFAHIVGDSDAVGGVDARFAAVAATATPQYVVYGVQNMVVVVVVFVSC